MMSTGAILVVDDEPEVHKMTRFVMKDWQFEGTLSPAYLRKLRAGGQRDPCLP